MKTSEGKHLIPKIVEIQIKIVKLNNEKESTVLTIKDISSVMHAQMRTTRNEF